MSVAVRHARAAFEAERRRNGPVAWPGYGTAIVAGKRGAALLLAGAPSSPAVARYGAGLTVEEASANLVYNPRLANGITGYLKIWGSETSLGAVAGDGPFGQAQFLRVVTTTSHSGEGAVYGPGGQLVVSAGVTYTFSVWVRGSGTVRGRVAFVAGGGGVSGADVTLTSTWTRVQVSATAGAATIAHVFVETAGAQVATIDAGGWQFEALPYATSYLDGSRGSGYAWAVGADASVSTRVAAQIGVPARLFSAAHGGFALWWRPNDGASFARDRVLLALPAGGDAITLRHDGATNVFRLSTPTPSGVSTVEAGSPSFVSGDDLLIIGAWDALTVALSVDGATWARGARGALRSDATDAPAEVGSAGASGLEANGVIGPFWCWDRPLLADRAHRLRNAARTLQPSEL